MTQLVLSIIAHNRPIEARLEKKKNPLKLQYAFSILNYKVAPIFLQYLENTLLQSQHVGPWKKNSIGFWYEPHKCDLLFISFWFVVLKVVKRIPDDTGHFSIHKCEKKNANQHDFRFHLSFHARCKPLHSNMSVMGK